MASSRGRRPAAAAAAVIGCLVSVMGCTVTSDGDSSVSGTVDDPTSWDLATPPSRSDVGMPADESVAVYETEDGRDVTFRLPEDTVLDVQARLVTFDSFTRPDPATGDPSKVVATSPLVDLDTGEQWFRETLAALGLPADEVPRWRRAAERAVATGSAEAVQSLPVDGSLGYLRTAVQARFAPLDEKVRVDWTLTWGPQPRHAAR